MRSWQRKTRRAPESRELQHDDLPEQVLPVLVLQNAPSTSLSSSLSHNNGDAGLGRDGAAGPISQRSGGSGEHHASGGKPQCRRSIPNHPTWPWEVGGGFYHFPTLFCDASATGKKGRVGYGEEVRRLLRGRRGLPAMGKKGLAGRVEEERGASGEVCRGRFVGWSINGARPLSAAAQLVREWAAGDTRAAPDFWRCRVGTRGSSGSFHGCGEQPHRARPR
jgi:hypothetical protein